VSGWEEDDGRPVGTCVRLACGHRIPLPWDLAPEAGVAELLHHAAGCPAAFFAPGARTVLASPSAWLPFPRASP
jgi:hypothetical protein